MSRPNIRSGISIDGKEVGNNEYEREGGVVKVYNDSLTLTQVWAENLEKEMDVITRFIDDEPCTVAVSVLFPGTIMVPMGAYTPSEFHYQVVQCNVEMVKPIQMGLAIQNCRGACHVWQFNFRFNIATDSYKSDLYYTLTRECGVNFDACNQHGIETESFGEYLMTSGLVLNPSVTWVSYNSLFDYGYLLRILTNAPLPLAGPTPEGKDIPLYSEFLSTLEFYLKRCFDLKVLVGGGARGEAHKYQLKVLAQTEGIPALSPQNQSGSNAMLTLKIFAKYYNERAEKEAIFVLSGIDKGN